MALRRLLLLEALAVGLKVPVLAMAACCFLFCLRLQVIVIVVFNVVVGNWELLVISF